MVETEENSLILKKSLTGSMPKFERPKEETHEYDNLTFGLVQVGWEYQKMLQLANYLTAGIKEQGYRAAVAVPKQIEVEE